MSVDGDEANVLISFGTGFQIRPGLTCHNLKNLADLKTLDILRMSCRGGGGRLNAPVAAGVP